MFVLEGFSYNGIRSDDMLDSGVILVHTDENNLTQSFASSKNLIRQHVQYRNSNFYMGADKSTYSLQIKITKKDNTFFTVEDRNKLMKIFLPDDNFHPFISDDFPELEFWVQFNKSSFINYFSNQGYFLLEAESNLPYPLTHVMFQQFDLSSNASSTIIEVNNISNIISPYMPIIEFTLKGDNTAFKIINHTNGGQVFDFGNQLSVGETINVNNETMEIISDTGNQRIDNFNFNFLKLVYGVNRLEVFGECSLKILCQFPMMI